MATLPNSDNLLRDTISQDSGTADEGEDSSVARRAIQELKQRLAQFSTKTDAEIAIEITQGSDLARACWIRDGLLVASTELEVAWKCTAHDLEQACTRGELFMLAIAGQIWYPAAFTTLARNTVAAVSVLLQRLDATSQFLFWHRKHGSLRGHTLHQALRDGELDAVRHVAVSFVRGVRIGQGGGVGFLVGCFSVGDLLQPGT